MSIVYLRCHELLQRYALSYLLVVLWSVSGTVAVAVEFFELKPIKYSETKASNSVEKLRLQEGFGVGARSRKAFLEEVLLALEVSVSSQVLVYSKTSLQNRLISMSSPRAIYFNDTTYVGYVQGGDIEVAVHDDALGLVFYRMSPPSATNEKAVIERSESCLSCHVSRRTKNVPGVFIRSVFVDEETESLRPSSFNTTHMSPYSERWGGWFVTGDWDQNEHLGNTSEIRRVMGSDTSLDKLDFLSSGYPRKTSDVVALAVLEHQCVMHNSLINAKLRYERTSYLYSSIEPDAKEGNQASAASRLARSVAEDVVRNLLFHGEAKMLGDGLSGSDAFIASFEAGGFASSESKLLRKIRGVGRLFKYRCSYMIHSPSFAVLPDAVKKEVFVLLNDALAENGSENGAHLNSKEKIVIKRILDKLME